MRISLASVTVNEQAKENVADCLETGMLARGKYVDIFEEMVARYVNCRYAVAVANGTLADQLVLQAMHEVYGFNNVVVPALTFAAQIGATLTANLYPRPVDIDRNDLAMVYTDGDYPGYLPFPAALMGYDFSRIIKRPFVLDSCETFHRNIMECGCTAATVSFYATHAVACGEGGMILTDDRSIADVCASLRDHGAIHDSTHAGPLSYFQHHYHGTNAKMSNLAAAVGVGMMDDADAIIKKRMDNAKLYDKYFGSSVAAKMVSPHGYPVDCVDRENRDFMILNLDRYGVDSRRLFSVIPREPGYRRKLENNEWPVASEIAQTHLYLPCHHDLTEEQIKYIVEVMTNNEPSGRKEPPA